MIDRSESRLIARERRNRGGQTIPKGKRAVRRGRKAYPAGNTPGESAEK